MIRRLGKRSLRNRTPGNRLPGCRIEKKKRSSARRPAGIATRSFYKLWSTSWHGLAMQPYTAAVRQGASDAPARRRHDRQTQVPRGNRRRGGLRSGNRPGRRAQIPHRPRHGREERLLLPHAPGSRPPPGAALGLRRPQEGLVRHGGQRRAAFSRPPRRGPRLDRPHVHLQHHLLQLPRDRTRDELRPGDRHLPHDVVRAGHQLRIVPRPGQGARARRWRSRRTGHKVEGHQDHSHQGVHARADERHVRHLPCEAGPAVADFPAGRQVLRSFRPHHPGTCRLLSRRPRPGRELHVHLLADEPLRQVGQARLQPLPHAQRPDAFRGREVEPNVHALPREGGETTRRSTAITRPAARGTSASPATCR